MKNRQYKEDHLYSARTPLATHRTIHRKRRNPHQDKADQEYNGGHYSHGLEHLPELFHEANEKASAHEGEDDSDGVEDCKEGRVEEEEEGAC